MQDRFLLFIAANAHRLPEGLVRSLFAVIAFFLWLFDLPQVRQLERNLAHTQAGLGERARSRRRIRHLSSQGLQSYFAYFAEAMTIRARSQEELDARVRIAGPYADDIMRQPVLSSFPGALGHEGNWDYAAVWCKKHVAPVATVAEKLSYPRLLETFVSIRRELGMTLYTSGDTHLINKLKDEMSGRHILVPLLADRDLSHHGIFVDFFDSRIRIARGPATLAIDCGLPLYVVNIYRERLTGRRKAAAHSRWGYVLLISGKIDPSFWRGFRLEDPEERQQAIVAVSREWARIYSADLARHPQDWHMLQPIFWEDLDHSRLSGIPKKPYNE